MRERDRGIRVEVVHEVALMYSVFLINSVCSGLVLVFLLILVCSGVSFVFFSFFLSNSIDYSLWLYEVQLLQYGKTRRG